MKKKSVTFIQPNYHANKLLVVNKNNPKYYLIKYAKTAYEKLFKKIDYLKKERFQFYFLNNYPNLNEEKYYKDLEHLNKEGVEIMGNTILEILFKNNYFSEDHK